MRGEEGELIIEELMEDWPETEEEIAQLRKRVLDNKFYRNFLVSEDGLYTAVMIRSNAFAESIQEEALDAMLEGVLRRKNNCLEHWIQKRLKNPCSV